MTENEEKAVRFIESIKNNAVVTLDHIAREEPNVNPLLYRGREEKADTILTMIEELEQYRAIGLLEELKVAMKYVYLAKKHGTVGQVIENCVKYEEIGTPEECRKSLEICKAMIDRKITPENMEEYMKFEDECVKRGFTFNSLLEAREKQTARKPKEYEDKYYACPVCGNPLLPKWEKYPDKLMDKSNGLPYCLGCGQKLDWSEDE